MTLPARALLTGLLIVATATAGCSDDDSKAEPSTSTGPSSSTTVRDERCTNRDEADFETMLRQRIQVQFFDTLPEGDCSDGTWTWSREISDGTTPELMFQILDLSFTSADWVRTDLAEPLSATWTGDCAPTLRCEVTAAVTRLTTGSHATISARSFP